MAEASASADVPMEDAAAAAVPPPVSFNIIGRGGNELTSGCFYRLILIINGCQSCNFSSFTPTL